MQNFGLSDNTLQLQAAAFEAMQAWQQRTENEPALATTSPGEAIREVYRNGNGPLRTEDSQASFEKMFRAAAVRQAAFVAALEG